MGGRAAVINSTFPPFPLLSAAGFVREYGHALISCQTKSAEIREKSVRIIISGFSLPVNRRRARIGGLKARKSAVWRDFRERTAAKSEYRLFWVYKAFVKSTGKESKKTFEKPAVLWFTVGGKSGSITDGFFMLNTSRSAGFLFVGSPADAEGFFTQTNP